MHNKGFTLVEILTAVIIVTILTVMAVPLYEKTIERSHLAEARTIMNRLQEAKLAAMDNMDCAEYEYGIFSTTHCPHMEHLGVVFMDEKTGQAATGRSFETKYFKYSLAGEQNTFRNGICAKRLKGDYANTIFAYHQEGNTVEFKCKNQDGCLDCCESYGYSSDPTLACTF